MKQNRQFPEKAVARIVFFEFTNGKGWKGTSYILFYLADYYDDYGPDYYKFTTTVASTTTVHTNPLLGENKNNPR